jgi:hypothetical protein
VLFGNSRRYKCDEQSEFFHTKSGSRLNGDVDTQTLILDI